MSSPNIPIVGAGGSTEVQRETAVPEKTQSPTAPTVPVTIGDAFKNQQDSVDKAAPNVSSLPVNAKSCERSLEDTGSFPAWSRADLKALQLKSEAQRQPETDIAAASPQTLPPASHNFFR